MLHLRAPNLLDILAVCLSLPEDERIDYKAFTGRDYDPDEVAAEAWLYNGPKWAISDENDDRKALVVCGYIPQRPGVYQSWYYAMPEAWKPHGKEVTDLTRAIIGGMLERDAHRLETLCLNHRAKALRWYGLLGLQYESTLCKFGANGEDAAMYVALRRADVLF
jgi:hypothetical protein